MQCFNFRYLWNFKGRSWYRLIFGRTLLSHGHPNRLLRSRFCRGRALTISSPWLSSCGEQPFQTKAGLFDSRNTFSKKSVAKAGNMLGARSFQSAFLPFATMVLPFVMQFPTWIRLSAESADHSMSLLLCNDLQLAGLSIITDSMLPFIGQVACHSVFRLGTTIPGVFEPVQSGLSYIVATGSWVMAIAMVPHKRTARQMSRAIFMYQDETEFPPLSCLARKQDVYGA